MTEFKSVSELSKKEIELEEEYFADNFEKVYSKENKELIGKYKKQIKKNSYFVDSSVLDCLGLKK